MTASTETHFNGANLPQQRLLIFFAHPDDEVFSCGGITIQNKQRGIYNVLVCATKGEAGEISLPELATPETLGIVRENELREAAKYMEIDELHFLGYRDSGMAGTEANQNPAAYVNSDDAEVVPRLVRFIRTIRPQVVVTFDPTGGYGHPDHITIHKQTVAAFHAAADPTFAPELGEPWQAQRLVYPAIRREMFQELHDQIVAQGMEAPNWGIDENEIPTQPVHVLVDVSDVAPTKWKAFKSHRTQFGPKHPFLQVPDEFIYKLIGKEPFEQAWPEPTANQMLTDLFEGLA